MNIVLLIDTYGGTFIGGGQVHVMHLKKHLETSKGNKVRIFSQTNESMASRAIYGFRVIPEVVFSGFSPDLIHVHGPGMGLSAKLLSLMLQVPVILTVHGSNLMDLKVRGFKAWLERFILTKVRYDYLITVDPSFLAYSQATERRTVVANGVDLPTKEINRTKTGDTLLYVGRLEEVKGVDILIQSLSTLINVHPGVRLKIVGEGSQKTKLEGLVKKHGLTHCVTFAGRRIGKELESCYREADLFILPSRSEGQPLTLLEAWSFGLPVIVTKVGANTTMVEEGVNGFLAEPNNIDNLVETMERAWKNKTSWQRIGKNGYNTVRNNYTWEKMVKKITEVYQKLI